MIKSHNLGYPRIGNKRETKFALEKYWRNEITLEQLLSGAEKLRLKNWSQQKDLDLIPVIDFSFYDHILDNSFLFGHIPKKVNHTNLTYWEKYFLVARGKSPSTEFTCKASEMTKWFDTNYHYIVPELEKETQFNLNPEQLLKQISEIKSLGLNAKVVLTGPLTYLWLCKEKSEKKKLDYLDDLLEEYSKLLDILKNENVKWVQFDEPILGLDLESNWLKHFNYTYKKLNHSKLNTMVATYFGKLNDNLDTLLNLPVKVVHLDITNQLSETNELLSIANKLPKNTELSIGLLDGRNIWKNNLEESYQKLKFLSPLLKKTIWIAPNCSLLHVPIELNNENKLPNEIKSWFSFANEKLEELRYLKEAFIDRVQNKDYLDHIDDYKKRNSSKIINDLSIQNQIENIGQEDYCRSNAFSFRQQLQKEKFNFPILPTTTIGSFPQTNEIRKERLKFKRGENTYEQYEGFIKNEIKENIEIQTKLDLDVYVHGEPERNDMVEFFGENLEGICFTQLGWVQSYGSRCVKPPIIYGDISRTKKMTLKWIKYAQSLTTKPVKGMLTGPVTILNWSFVRDDQALEKTCKQIALAIREEVLELENAGIEIIQIDEAALREGLPLRTDEHRDYLKWAIDSFKLAANGVKDTTQIHTHMCYSNFNAIIDSIADMDADVITIESSRSGNKLLEAFKTFKYPNEIGPGVYDIHSPAIPHSNDIEELIKSFRSLIPIENIWVNPDCGLKTRTWSEVIPALENMVQATKEVRKRYQPELI